jgi:hypothetical protein
MHGVYDITPLGKLVLKMSFSFMLENVEDLFMCEKTLAVFSLRAQLTTKADISVCLLSKCYGDLVSISD